MWKNIVALEYSNEDEKNNFSSRPKEDKEEDALTPPIPSICVNLVVASSQEKILPMEGEQDHEQTYMLIKTV